MLEIYKRDEFDGHLNVLVTFNSFDEMFRVVPFNTDLAVIFGYDDVTRHNAHAAFGDHQPASPWEWFPSRKFCYVAFWNGDFVTPDRLVGLHRKFIEGRRNTWSRRWYRSRGQKKGAFGWLRQMHTTHERRWANAWDEEEDAPRVRAKRNARHLPDAWDDRWADAQKSWKWQSKRKHQWKKV